MVKGNSPKKDASSNLKLSLSGNASPYSSSIGPMTSSTKVKKSAINFVHDMKKHGIDKDIDSVRAMR